MAFSPQVNVEKTRKSSEISAKVCEITDIHLKKEITQHVIVLFLLLLIKHCTRTLRFIEHTSM